MKKIGLIGGMSWESTELYYRAINLEVKKKLGGHHSAQLVIESVDFQVIKEMQFAGDWQSTADILSDCARNLEKAGAEFFLIGTNTMHKVVEQVQAAVSIPLVHLADATAKRIVKANYKKVGFLGTKFSMEDDFYTGRLINGYGLDVITPNQADRDLVHDVIYNELCLGKVEGASREQYLRIMDDLTAQGAECIIEGCTEIVLLVDQSHTTIPLFDTTTIHAEEAVAYALS